MLDYQRFNDLDLYRQQSGWRLIYAVADIDLSLAKRYSGALASSE
jgi:hypothetical protein